MNIQYDENTPIWRYMDLSKFINMIIEPSSLFFCRSDLFEDPFEGSYTKTEVMRRDEELYKQLRGRKIGKVVIGSDGQVIMIDENIGCRIDKINQFIRKTVFISCWHINDTESEAMWKLYLKSDEGIAIKTTINKLRKALINSQKKFYLSHVNYIDFEKESIQHINGSFIDPFFHKRKAFSHENEFRAIISEIETVDIGEKRKLVYKICNEEKLGVNIRIELNDFIDEVRVSPTSPQWFYSVVENIMQKYNMMLKPQKSELLNLPLF